MIKDIGRQILAVLFPPACIACHRVEGVISLPLGLCSLCQSKLKTLDRDAFPVWSGASGSPVRVYSRWSYEPPFDAVIHGLKFGHLEFLGSDLATGLHPIVIDIEQEIDVVVPIPLHWLRLRTRGFNQAEAIGRPLAARLGLPLIRALRRRRPTAAQARLDRETRRHNLRLAFATRSRHRSMIVGHRILLVDDVVTTGATLETGARCLENTGAKSVICATAGRTPASSVGLPALR